MSWEYLSAAVFKIRIEVLSTKNDPNSDSKVRKSLDVGVVHALKSRFFKRFMHQLSYSFSYSFLFIGILLWETIKYAEIPSLLQSLCAVLYAASVPTVIPPSCPIQSFASSLLNGPQWRGSLYTSSMRIRKFITLDRYQDILVNITHRRRMFL